MGIVCDVNGCKWNDGRGNCECDGIYVSDVETGDPQCMSAEFSEEEIEVSDIGEQRNIF